MTITVKPIVPTQQTTNIDKMAGTNTPEVPFVHVLAKEVAQQHQPTKANSTKDTSDKAVKSSADAADTAASEAQNPEQLSSEMLAMMGVGQQPVPATTATTATTAATQVATAATATALTSSATIPAALNRPIQANPTPLTDVNKKITNPTDALDLPKVQSGKDARTPLETLTDGSSDKSSNKISDKSESKNFADLLKGTESTQSRTSITQAELPTVPQLQATSVNLAVSHPEMIMTDKITARVGTPAWDQSLSQKIVWMSNSAQQTASLTLNPPDLGPLQIVLSVNNDQANATFIAAQPEVRLAIEAAMPKLREMMSDAGIQLGQANVSSGDTRQQNNNQQSGASNRNAQSVAVDDGILANSTHITTNITTGLGLVNTFA
ncbi:MAG: flagellar hook-length control protein FliK [Sulfuriferula sp.]